MQDLISIISTTDGVIGDAIIEFLFLKWHHHLKLNINICLDLNETHFNRAYKFSIRQSLCFNSLYIYIYI